MVNEDYCEKCGSTGILLDGSPCSCRISKVTFSKGLSMIDMPQQYSGLEFDKRLVNPYMGKVYQNFLSKLHDEVSKCTMQPINYLICSPKLMSKRVMAYSAIQNLFQAGIDTFPIYDLLELKKITIDMDLSKKQTYTVDNPEKVLTVKYLFAIVPVYLTFEVYQMMSILVDRRTRRGNSTIFLYDGDVSDLEAADFKRILKGLRGNGDYGTIKVCNYTVKEDISNEQ